MTEATNADLTGTYQADRHHADVGGVPSGTVTVRVAEADAAGYYTVEYLASDGTVLEAQTRPAYRVAEAMTDDGEYAVTVPTSSPYPGGIRTTHVMETVACLKTAVQARDPRQVRLAFHSATSAVTGA